MGARAVIERIVSAAVLYNGLVMSRRPPARHNNILRCLSPRQAKAIGPDQQGFLTSEGRFVGRRAALIIARDAGQLIRPPFTEELFSEDVW